MYISLFTSHNFALILMYIIHFLSINLLFPVNFILIILKIIIFILIILIPKQSSASLRPTCIESFYLWSDSRPRTCIVFLISLFITHIIHWFNPAQMVHNIPYIFRQ